MPLEQNENIDKKIVLISCKENLGKYIQKNIVEVIDIGSSKDYLTISQNILRKLTKLKFQINIFIIKF